MRGSGPAGWSPCRQDGIASDPSASDTVEMSRAPLLGEGLVSRRVRVAKEQVVFVKGVFEASEGLGALFAERGGDLVIAAPRSREADLDEVLADLAAEVGAVIESALEARDRPDGHSCAGACRHAVAGTRRIL